MSNEPSYVVVVGGANTDLKARSTGPVVAATSNPGRTSSSPGGVGRNIAENLARLGTATRLIAAVGTDPAGDTLLDATARAGVDITLVARVDEPTGTYTAVLDESGELVVAVADMAATAALTPDRLDAAATATAIAAATLVVLDGNLSLATVAHVLALAEAAGVDVVLEPVSVAKAGRLVLGAHPVHTITPNLDELGALTGLPTGSPASVAAAVRELSARSVETVWVRLGARGSLLGRDGELVALAAEPTSVVDVTGAGDAMTAAYCHGLVTGATPLQAARLGHRAAALTVASEHTVCPDLGSLLG